MNVQRLLGPLVGGLLLLAVVYVGFGVSATPLQQSNPVATPTPVVSSGGASQPTPLPGNLDQVVVIEDGQSYVIRQLITRDGIRPIYEPQFTRPEDAIIDDDSLVMGLEINGDARAYPVNILRRREMVDDVVGGTPVLVTW